ncbi:helicase associated domain-containing protein [Streptomyces sp. NPDC050485]|uniref:helicase associated domain-containing protein n=1 Tax=Streptomyces sp. NPDC050485 TaxID=3365617 RepID=UPI0037B49590
MNHTRTAAVVLAAAGLLLTACSSTRPKPTAGPVMVAKFIKFRVVEPEKQDWIRGYEAAARYQKREGDLEVPYEHLEGAYPLGRWLSDQRRACGPDR